MQTNDTIVNVTKPPPLTEAGRNETRTDRPFVRALAVAGCAYAILVGIALAMGAGGPDLSARLGYLLGSRILIPYLITGIWARFSKHRWPWWRYGVTFLVTFLLNGCSAALREFSQR
jgi:hypothetical protein